MDERTDRRQDRHVTCREVQAFARVIMTTCSLP